MDAAYWHGKDCCDWAAWLPEPWRAALFDQVLAEVAEEKIRNILRRNPWRACEMQASRASKLQRMQSIPVVAEVAKGVRGSLQVGAGDIVEEKRGPATAGFPG